MIIISQDGLWLVPMERYAIRADYARVTYPDDNIVGLYHVLAVDSGESPITLGTYKDEDEAKETLMAIETAYIAMAELYQMPRYGWKSQKEWSENEMGDGKGIQNQRIILPRE